MHMLQQQPRPRAHPSAPTALRRSRADDQQVLKARPPKPIPPKTTARCTNKPATPVHPLHPYLHDTSFMKASLHGMYGGALLTILADICSRIYMKERDEYVVSRLNR